jgi:hypothetical protein
MWNKEKGAVYKDFKRYPHVRALIEHYAGQAKSSDMLNMLKMDSFSKEDAYRFGRFIVSMIDAMAADMQSGVAVLGGVDNTEMIPDIDYEVRLFLDDRGWDGVWDEICDEA